MKTNAKFSEDPAIASLPKSLLEVWSRKPGNMQVLSAASGIPKDRIEAIAKGDAEPEPHEVSMLKMLGGA